MNYLSLSNTKLFQNISTDNIQHVLNCLQSRLESFEKEEVVFLIGDKTQEIGLIISGSVLIENNDLWGNRSILAVIEKNHIFAESYAFANEKLKVTVIANEDTEILF